MKREIAVVLALMASTIVLGWGISLFAAVPSMTA